MTRIAWQSLMRLGLCQLGLAPAVFWDLTPAELLLLAGAATGEGALSRADFDTLQARFPDVGRGRSPQENLG